MIFILFIKNTKLSLHKTLSLFIKFHPFHYVSFAVYIWLDENSPKRHCWSPYPWFLVTPALLEFIVLTFCDPYRHKKSIISLWSECESCPLIWIYKIWPWKFSIFPLYCQNFSKNWYETSHGISLNDTVYHHTLGS